MTKYFVTGATGFIGSAVVDSLLANGHQVLGLARSDEAEKLLMEKGVEVLRGDLEDLESVRRGARDSDGVLHLGFIHDFKNFFHALEVDREVTLAIVDELKGTNKVFVYTNGLGGLRQHPGHKSCENDTLDPTNLPPTLKTRVSTELLALDSAKDGVRAMCVRLPPAVHGPDDQGFISQLFRRAVENEVVYYVNDGSSAWSSVHRKDAALLYRLVAEKGTAGHAYHAVHDEAITSKEISRAIAKNLNLETQSIEFLEVTENLGIIGFFFGTSLRTTSLLTQETLGWKPREVGLLEDIIMNYSIDTMNKDKPLF